MKTIQVEIEFEKSDIPGLPCRAHCKIGEHRFLALGRTYAEAQSCLLEKIRSFEHEAEPPLKRTVILELND